MSWEKLSSHSYSVVNNLGRKKTWSPGVDPKSVRHFTSHRYLPESFSYDDLITRKYPAQSSCSLCCQPASTILTIICSRPPPLDFCIMYQTLDTLWCVACSLWPVLCLCGLFFVLLACTLCFVACFSSLLWPVLVCGPFFLWPVIFFLWPVFSHPVRNLWLMFWSLIYHLAFKLLSFNYQDLSGPHSSGCLSLSSKPLPYRPASAQASGRPHGRLFYLP
jgi:hypothetical protein